MCRSTFRYESVRISHISQEYVVQSNVLSRVLDKSDIQQN